MIISTFLNEVKDFRKPQGKKYPIQSVVKLIVAGLLSKQNNLKASHRF